MSRFFQTLKQLVSRGGIEGYFAIKYAELVKKSQLMRSLYEDLAARATSVIREGNILEVGSGPGFLAIEMALLSSDLKVTGLDISQTMIEIAAENVREHGLSERVEFKKGTASEMPFEDSQFDFVITSGSLHHWKEPIEVFDEIHRVLKEGKKALVSDLRKDAPRERIEALTMDMDSRFMRWGLRKSLKESYTAQGIERLIKTTRFADFKINTQDVSLEIWLRRQSTCHSRKAAGGLTAPHNP